VLTGLVAVGVVLSWAARWIDPHSYGVMSAAGLFMPALFVCNCLLLLYWAIRWRWGVWIPLAVFVVGVWSVTLFFRPEFTRDHSSASRDRSLVSVATYNVRGMMRPVEGWAGRVRSSMGDVIGVVDSLRPDILCIQEFQSTRDNPKSRFDEELPSYNYKRVRYNIKGGAADLGWGNAIYSKFPITNSGHIDFEGTSNSILWVDVAVRRDTMRVFCAHLQTTAIKVEDERYIVGGDFVGDSTRNSRVKSMLGKLTRGYVVRAEQADTLASCIALSPHPVVVCGDFNDTPMSYAYRRVSRRLRDAFREAGKGYGYTYRGFFDMLRIDYVLHSREFECVEYASPSFDASDHNPVVVKLRM
jgi:endonuclease/exonuclease/phosphatase family metal-dependent hydrolase